MKNIKINNNNKLINKEILKIFLKVKKKVNHLLDILKKET